MLNDWKQENPLVEQQWIDAVKYWLTAYNVDGFRFDLVKGLGDSDSYGATYNAASNTWSGVTDSRTNAYNQSRIDRMKRIHDAIKSVRPDAYFINEDLAFAEEENALAANGQLNWANLNYPSINYEYGVATDQANLNRFYAPLDSERKWGSTVSYMESHDEERVAYAIENYTGSVSATNTIKKSEELTMRRLGSIAAQMLVSPGAHMIWQFQEFGADQTTKNESGNDTSPKNVVWSYLDNEYRAGLRKSYADILAVRKNNPELFADSVETSMDCNFISVGLKSIVLTSGTKQLVLMVNSNANNYARSFELPAAASHDASDYHLLAASHGQTPSVSADRKVSLRGCGFALFGTGDISGISDVPVADTAGVTVYATESGDIVVEGDYRTLSVFDIAGRSVGRTSLPAGVYIVRVDSRSFKIAVP